MINSESVIMTDFFMVKYYVKEINYFNLTRNEYDNFINLLYGFVKEISYYNRLKSCTTIACKKCKYHTYLPATSIFFLYGPRIGEKVEARDIFNFDFNGNYKYYFRKSLMERQNLKIEEVIKDNELIMEYFNKESIKFENNIKYIRGHDLYNFLQKYLYQKFDIDISPNYKKRMNSKYLDIVKLLDVKMDFVNGLGEKIK